MLLYTNSQDWSDWADVQPDLSLHWSHKPYCWFCRAAAQLCLLKSRHERAMTKNRYNQISSLTRNIKWAPSSKFVSSSIPSWQILNAHAQPFRGTRDLAFCLKGPLDSLLVWASSEGSGETARMRRLAWTFAARIGDKYQIRLARPKWASS